MPRVEIWTGPAGSGKSVSCRARLLEQPASWLIVSSEQQRARWRRALPTAEGRIKTLYDLARELTGAALDERELMTPAFRLLILRQIIARSLSAESYFARVADTAGFGPCLADLLSELRQGETDAERLVAAVRAAAPSLADPTFGRKGEEIAALQAHYEQYLEHHHLLDAEGMMRLGIRCCHEPSVSLPWPEEVLIDGFPTFTPLQLSLIEALAPHVDRLTITLAYDAARPVLFAQTGETLARLRDRFPAAIVRELPAVAGEAPVVGLRLLEERLFRGEGAIPLPDDTLTLFEAPDGLMQAEMVARETRRLLDRHEYHPNEIGVLVRSMVGLAPLLRNVFTRYQVPVWLQAGERLGENPFIACVSTLLRVWLRDWQRDDLLRLLRSSYLGLSRFAVNALERRARGQGLQHGRAQWLNAALVGESASALSALLCRLADWQDRMREQCTPAGLRDTLAGALADLGLLTGMRRGEIRLIQADLCAWESAVHIFNDLARLDRLAGERAWRFDEFAAMATAGWEAGFYNLPPPEEECVQILEIFDATGHAFRAAFVLDLVEGVFPRRPHEDPCFRDDERKALARCGGIALPLSAAQADEERMLFYQAVTAARERLVLCYPKTDPGGHATLRSFFLDEVEEAVTALPVTRLALTQIVAGPEEAVLPRERLACLAAALGDGKRPEADPTPGALLDLCAALRQEAPEAVERLLAAPDARRPYHLVRADVRTRLAGRHGTYNVSEIESVRACPFQHFLKYRLRLDETRDGAGTLEMGQVLHEALRQFFSEVRESGFPAPAAALARLQAICGALFAQTPLDAHPYRVRLAEGALMRYLAGFIQREAEYRAAVRLEPFLFEFAFGPQAASDDASGVASGEEGEEREEVRRGAVPTAETVPTTVRTARGPTDAASTPRPLLLRSGDREVRLSGKIDRIDRTVDGHALVFDYKLGKARPVRETQEGRSLQMPIYWLAVEQLLGLTVVGGGYDALRQGQRPIIARCDLAGHAFSHKGILGKNALGRGPFEQIKEQVQAAVFAAVALIEQLESAPAPADDRTCSFCPYQDCCRPEEAGVAFGREAEGREDE